MKLFNKQQVDQIPADTYHLYVWTAVIGNYVLSAVFSRAQALEYFAKTAPDYNHPAFFRPFREVQADILDCDGLKVVVDGVEVDGFDPEEYRKWQ